MVSRADRSPFAEWLWTVDRYLVAGFVVLMVGGIVLSFAASPAVAERLDIDSYHFIKRQALFLIPALVVMFGVSALSPRLVRRVALAVFVLSLVMMVATLFLGVEAKGSRRWISFVGLTVQPSEFLKPALIVLSAFLLSEAGRRPDVPGTLFSILLFIMSAALLIAQPDFGQTMLLTIVFGALLFLNGLPWVAIVPIGVLGVGGLVSAYLMLPHVQSRVDRFLDPGSGDTFNVDRAIEAFVSGSWFGRGPGEGTIKRVLPESHTDFIFAVAAEEFGIVMCLLLVLVFGFVVLRGLSHAAREEDPFSRLAIAGLMILFGIQACINMAVNLNLMPAKGMTLPFISYGGSSLLASALSMGFVLALTRRRPQASRHDSVIVSRLSPSSLA
ncbi:MAG: putative lipid II flippase FtsW [Stappia sp.]|uniref:putative lipid II flippase FtsW n=1 Tax=Stappia sp. TaxID=1870903 RepID=UPI000C5F3E9E|nr:putative lipid II flippase FtsW [Stappia sp.]MAA97368.1 putative lipid II flippase FtsW [Stappia sp.]MBM21901.1 putative lipid II flippase FtsW [Stappia sp.]